MGLVHLTKKNWNVELEDLFEDGDFTGENVGYLSDEAAAGKYTSNLEYAIATASNNHPHDWKEAVREVIAYFKNHEGRYYDEVQEYELEMGDDLIISLHTVSP